ncbi:MAG: hypothetical protein JST79_18960 [Acidobacteria bacterium]|nr:hypothetical protein [Acidobacteriota bacterium]
MVATSPPSLYSWRLLLLSATALAVVLPFLRWGVPSGHDFEFHFNSWIEVVTHWQQGVLYPHWAGLAHYGYGEARFVFYPPLSWLLGALLGVLLPWTLVPAVYIAIVLTLSGSTMFLLARRWLSARDALFAACFYAANPYSLIVVYWRSAYAELLAAAILPLLLLFLLQAADSAEGQRGDFWRPVMKLGLVMAAVWLTNAPSAVMATYSLALLTFVVAMARRAPRLLLAGGLAVLLGLALAAFYVLPAVYEQRWVDIEQVIAPGLRPQDNFLFTAVQEHDHDVFNRLVSIVALSEMIALLTAAAWCGVQRKWRGLPLWCLLTWGAASLGLLSSLSAPLWRHLPELRFMQLPWRWLGCLNLVLVLLVADAWRKWYVRTLLCLALLAVIGYGWQRVQPPWWDVRADLQDMVESQKDSRHGNLQDGPGYEGTDEYVPLRADPYEIHQEEPRVTLLGTEGQVQVDLWNSESRQVAVTAAHPGTLLLRLFHYPAWKVEVNGRVVSPATRRITGQMLVPVQAGSNHVQITFVRTRDRVAGGVISLLAALGLGLWWWREARVTKHVLTTQD